MRSETRPRSNRTQKGVATAALLIGATVADIDPAMAQAVPVPVAIVAPLPTGQPAFFKEYLVAERDGLTFPTNFVNAATALVASTGGTVTALLPHVFIARIQNDPGTVLLGIQTLAQQLMNKPVETTFNFPVKLAAPIAPPCHITQSCRTADSLALEHYIGPSNIAWPLGALQTMPRANDLMTTMGSGTSVALIDAPPIGIEPNSELKPRAVGFDIGPPTSFFAPGHGTQVASIVFGRSNGQFSEGIAPGATRHHYGVGIPDLGSVGGIGNASLLLSDVLALFHYLGTLTTPPDVLAMSAGLPFGFTPLRDAIRQLSDIGVLMFFASGNESATDCLYPGRYNFPNSICVGATGVLVGNQVDSYQVATYSNQGVDLALPGTQIPVPKIDNQGVLVRDTMGNIIYENKDGTSFATPHAAGLAARILSELRNNPARYPHVATYTHAQMAGYVRNLLFTKTTDIDDVGFDIATGHGIPDLAAIFDQMQLDARPSNHQLKQTIQEWNDPAFFGNPILSQLLMRTQNVNPLTKIALNFTYAEGNCFGGKLSVGKPKLDVGLSAFQASITSMTGDQATVDLSYDLRVPVRIEVKYRLPVMGCIVPSIKLTITGDWRSAQTGYRNTMRVKFKLDGEGYRVDDVTVTGPETKQLFIGYQGIPSFLNQYVSRYDDRLKEFAVPAVNLFEEGVNDHVVQMVERMLNATLSGEREEPYAYFKYRRPEPLGDLPLALDYFGTLDRHSHLSAIGSNQSIFEATAVGLPTMQAMGASQDPILGANPRDVTHGIETNSYAYQLDYLAESGVLNSSTNDQLVADIRTTTESQPDVLDAVRVQIDNVRNVVRPSIIPDRTVMGFFGRLRFIVTADVRIDGGPRNSVTMIYWPFVSEYSTFKEYAREMDYAPFPLDLRWEERLVVDPFQAAPSTAQQVFSVFGFVEQPSLIRPALPIISTDEVTEIVRSTILNEYQRAVGSVSTKRIGLDARLGQSWGCLGSVVRFVNFYSQQLANVDFLDLRSETNCWDLNLGVYGPERDTVTRDLAEHLVHDDTLNLRRTPLNLVPTAGAPTPFFMSHPQDAGYQGAVLPISYGASGGGQPDFFYSVNGEWRTAPGAATRVELVEEAWQATILRSAGTRFLYVPEKMSFAPGEKMSFEMFAAARDSAPAQLEVGNCWLRFPVDFIYGRQRNFAQGPTNTQPLALEGYQETRVDTPNDAWTNILNCGGGGSSDVVEPID